DDPPIAPVQTPGDGLPLRFDAKPRRALLSGGDAIVCDKRSLRCHHRPALPWGLCGRDGGSRIQLPTRKRTTTLATMSPKSMSFFVTFQSTNVDYFVTETTRLRNGGLAAAV